MRDWFARTFPTIAGWDLPTWIMLFLNTMISSAVVAGAFYQEGSGWNCPNCPSLEEVHAVNEGRMEPTWD